MKRIPLTEGKVALISDCDYWLVRQFKWYAVRNRGKWRAQAKGSYVRMHRLIGGFPPFDIDHKNGNGLDNRRSNLRPASNSENQANRGKPRNNTSGLKSVYLRQDKLKWCAKITVMKQQIHLGSFKTIWQARDAYLVAASNYFGSFSRA